MAPSRNFYFPPLDQCLNGEHQLLSWHSAAQALTDPPGSKKSPFLLGFLSDDTVKTILSRPLSPFDKPSAESKSSFETRTAPSQVIKNQNGGYNLDEIKSDATWLSEKVKLDEITALRVVVLEWQGRAAEQLSCDLVQLAIEPSFTGAVSIGPGPYLPVSSILNAPLSSNSSAGIQKEKRRQNILRLLVEEKASIVRIADILIGSALGRKHREGQRAQLTSTGGLSPDEVVGDELFARQEQLGPAFLLSCMDTVSVLLDQLQSGGGWSANENDLFEIEEAWGTATMMEIIFVQKLLLLHLFSTTKLTSADLTVHWFKIMDRHGFLAVWQPPFESQLPLLGIIHMTISLISLVILQLSTAITYLQSPESHVSASKSTKRHYLSDTVAFNDVHGFITKIASSGSSPATLAVFGWLIVHFNARQIREVYRLEMEAAEQEGEGSNAGIGLRQFRAHSEILDSICLGDEEMELLANYAVGVGNAHGVIADLATNLSKTFSAPVDRIFQQCARLRLLELIGLSLEITRYDLPVINATLWVLSGQRDFWSLVDASRTSVLDPVCSVFLDGHDCLRPLLLDVAQLRFPYEILPFLRFARALAVDISGDPDQHELLALLSSLPYFVQKLPSSFGAHELSREETEHNYIRLTAELPIFYGARNSSRSIAGKGSQLALTLAHDFNVMSIPTGTEGLNNGDMLVTWNFTFDVIAYLTTLLSTAIRNSSVYDFATRSSVDLDVAAEIVRLFNTILAAGLKTDPSDPCEVNAVKMVFGTHDDGSEAPLIRVVFELFEQELQSQREQPGGEGFDLLVACTQSLFLVTKIFPDKVWPFLSRSRFLENDGLAAIVAGTEMILGRYEFLRASIRLYEALVNDVITNAVKRQIAGADSGSRAVTRFRDQVCGRGSPESIMGKTLLAFTRTFANALESMDGWRFADLEERLCLTSNILSAFDVVATYSQGHNGIERPEKRLTAALGDSAEYLLDVFGSAAATELSVIPILVLLASGVSRSTRSTLFVAHEALWTQQTLAAVKFADSILRINVFLRHGSSHLEAQLFKAVPVLASLYVANETYRGPICRLLTTLVDSAAQCDKEPPSLLGHMGEDKAKAFLSLIAQLGRPLDSLELEISIWKLASSIVKGRQQWFATFLLTSRTPREEVKARGTEVTDSKYPLIGRSLLQFALDELCKIADLPPARSIAMLEFIMLSQNYWPWAMSPLRSHSRFITEIQVFAGDLRPEDVQGSGDRTILTADRYRMASLIAEILAMYLHQTKQVGSAEALVRDMIPRLSFLKNFAIAAPEENVNGPTFSIPTYNTNMHQNLEKNFSKKYPGIHIDDFKRTVCTDQSEPRDYYYDTSFAERLLGFSDGWNGRRNDGYATDFVRANINLYLVQTQVDALRGWRMLAVELSNFLKREQRVATLLTKVVSDCLNANIHNNLPQNPLFQRLNQVRADFAFVLLQKLVLSEILNNEVKALLGKTWDAIRASGQDFETAFTGDGAEYYRSLLKLLFLALHFHFSLHPTQIPTAKSASQSTPSTVLQIEPVLLEILSKVVAAGFRSLANTLHDKPSLQTVPGDLVLITAILQCILRVPAMKLLHAQIALQFAGNNTIRYAMSLFSWSDQLAGATNGDPIYAELSMLFILELSSVPNIAENMAVEGVLASISTASITSYFRREAGIGPFDAQGRLHAVWAKGILPLCLNMLSAVGSPIAPEVSAFLNQFPGQLLRSTSIFGKSNVLPSETGRYQVSLAMAAELHNLALLCAILERFKNESPNGIEIETVKFDCVVMKEDLEGWMRGRASLLERITPIGDREVKLANTKASSAWPVDNKLEEFVLAECKSAVDCASLVAK